MGVLPRRRHHQSNEFGTHALELVKKVSMCILGLASVLGWFGIPPVTVIFAQKEGVVFSCTENSDVCYNTMCLGYSKPR